MREQLIQYINLLFAAADCEEVKQEILQNTLDRYDDLITQGKQPEAAYRLAISGIGDINEILDTPHISKSASHVEPISEMQQETEENLRRKKTRAIAVTLYILCAVPIILLDAFGLDTLGVCLTIAIVAYATYLMIITAKKEDAANEVSTEKEDVANVISKEKEAKHPLKDSIGSLIWWGGLVAYFAISFTTGAWYITWLIFPMMAFGRGLSDAIIDLVEVMKHES